MKIWLTDSITYRCISTLLSLLRSISKKIESGIGVSYKNSLLAKLVNRFLVFLDKESHSKKSVFYRTMSRVGALLNKIASSLHSFIEAQLNHSLFWRLVKDIDAGFRKDPYVLSGLICSGFFVAFGAAALAGRVAGLKVAAILGTLFIVSLVLLFSGEKAVRFITESATYRLLRMAIKAVLP